MLRKVLKNKKVLARCHIYQMLKKSAKDKHLSFHTPGHKWGKWDITELSYSDNLASPRGCIARAQADIARILGAAAAFIVTDGSTAGVLSMLFTAKNLGVKRIAVCENSHKSIFNGCAMLGLTPIVISARKEKGIPLPVAVEDLQGIEADAILITSPDYYGNIHNLSSLRAYCDSTGKRLLIDGAHGGHLHGEKGLYAGTYADMWVDGVHKSLPALTQGAVVCARTEEVANALAKGVDVFRTTSPSYPIMASVEYAVKYPKNEWLQTQVKAWQESEARLYTSDDWTKVSALFGENAAAIHEELQRKGVFAEFCDGNVISFYLSPATKKKSFLRLKRTVERLLKKYPYMPIKDVHTPVFLEKTGEKAWIDIEKSEGQVCAENCGLFPPCTPLIRVGEVITREKMALLLRADNVFGIRENKISVFKGKEEE